MKTLGEELPGEMARESLVILREMVPTAVEALAQVAARSAAPSAEGDHA